MSRNKLQLRIFNILLIIALFSFTGHGNKKNVLFIAVDDLKPLLGAYGYSAIHTPNIDKLAEGGTVFLNSQCQQAVCSPSRASLMFGMRPDKTKIWDLHTPVRTATKDKKTIAQHFKDNGYETVAFGKIFHISMADKEHDQESWSVSYSKANVNSYPKETGEPYSHFQDRELKKRMKKRQRQLESEGVKPGKARGTSISELKVSTERLDLPDEAYVDGQIANNAVRMIGNLSGKDKPFFVAVGFKKPHLPFVAPAKYWDMYERSDMELSSWQAMPVGAPKLAMHTWGELKSYSDIPPLIQKNGLLSADKQRELIHGYKACVSFIDAQIGKLLNALEENGVADETIIVLWGDHGWHLGDHGLWCKHSNFEQAVRSPLIFSSPGMREGQKNPSPVGFVDIFPTLCDLADLSKPDQLDGISLKPIMSGEKESVKPFEVSQYHRGNTRMGYSLRNERYRYTAWFEINYREGERPEKNRIIAEELYDYHEDPHETKNFAGSKTHQELVKKLNNDLLQFLKRQ